MSKTRLLDILAVVISVAPFIFFIALRDSLPDRMPIHWDASGVANGWTDREQVPVYLGIMAALGIGVYFLLRFVKNLDPRKTAKLNERIAEKVGIGIVIFMSTINILILLPSTGSLNL